MGFFGPGPTRWPTAWLSYVTAIVLLGRWCCCGPRASVVRQSVGQPRQATLGRPAHVIQPSHAQKAAVEIHTGDAIAVSEDAWEKTECLFGRSRRDGPAAPGSDAYMYTCTYMHLLIVSSRRRCEGKRTRRRGGCGCRGQSAPRSGIVLHIPYLRTGADWAATTQPALIVTKVPGDPDGFLLGACWHARRRRLLGWEYDPPPHALWASSPSPRPWWGSWTTCEPATACTSASSVA